MKIMPLRCIIYYGLLILNLQVVALIGHQHSNFFSKTAFQAVVLIFLYLHSPVVTATQEAHAKLHWLSWHKTTQPYLQFKGN